MTPILHHYWGSNYAEKARMMLGLKRLTWGSVIISDVMPKPDLVALTGGYSKTPVLQIGGLRHRAVTRPPLGPAAGCGYARA